LTIINKRKIFALDFFLTQPTWVLLFFLLLIAFLALYQCLNALTHAGVLKNTQG